MGLSSLTVHEALDLLRRKEISPKEIVEALIRRIEQVDGVVHGYLSFDPQRALEEAEHADVSLPLGGIPIAIKDVVSVKGHPCGCASKILKGYTAPFDATAIKKLRAARVHPFRPDEHGRVRHGVVYGKFCIRADPITLGTRNERPAVQVAAIRGGRC